MTNNPPTITTSASTASTSSSNPSEVVVWKNIKTKGFWHKRMVQAEELTNYNVILNDVKIPWSTQASFTQPRIQVKDNQIVFRWSSNEHELRS